MTYPLQAGERIVGTILGAPMVVKGRTWFPANQLIFWAVFGWSARQSHPDWPVGKHAVTGALCALVFLGSEWLHNLAHTAFARWIGKPVDAVRIFMGMPLLVYSQESDQSVKPCEHILRAISGPLFNACLLGVSAYFRWATRPGSAARMVADTAVKTNGFLSTASLLPIPGIDGGSALKWAAVQGGKSAGEADRLVVMVNRVMPAGLGTAAVLAGRKKRRLASTILGLFTVVSLLIGLEILSEGRNPGKAHGQSKSG